jgi:hypothetical protein
VSACAGIITSWRAAPKSPAGTAAAAAAAAATTASTAERDAALQVPLVGAVTIAARDTMLQVPQYTHICREAGYSCLGIARAEVALRCPTALDSGSGAGGDGAGDSTGAGGLPHTAPSSSDVSSARGARRQAELRTAYWKEQVAGAGLPAGVARIDGWLEAGDAAATGTLMKLQSDVLGVRGHVAEIGVHHGKFLIWMALHLRAGERAVGLDLFELAQSENVDRSGSGNLASLRANAAHYSAPVEALAVNSLRLPLCFFRQQRLQGLVRFFSVDGGHFVDHAYEDCWSAWSALAPGGVIAVDDFLHGTSVMQGTLRFLDANADARAFLVGPNKLFICHRDFYNAYFEAMAAALPPYGGGGQPPTVDFGAARQLVMMPAQALTLHGWFLKAVLEHDREVWHCGLLARPYAPPVFKEVCTSA